MYSTVYSPAERYLGAPPPRPQKSLNQLWLKVGAAALAAVAAIVGLVALQQPEPHSFGKVLVIDNADADVASNGLDTVEGPVMDAAASLASGGGGTVQVVVASGGSARTVGTADLKVMREGQLETDPQVRARVVEQRVSGALATGRGALPNEPGRNLLSLLDAAAQEAPPSGQPYTVYYVGFGLGTVDPADARVSLAGEPDQAVTAIAEQLPKLPGARLYAVFPAAAGRQPALNVATAAWRLEYWKRLAAAMGATLAGVTADTAPAPAATGAAPAPVIANIPDPTPVPPCGKHCTPPPPNSAPVKFGSGSFLPDSDRFVDPGAAARALAPLAEAWKEHPGADTGAVCTGRAAAFGAAEGARALSSKRAGRAAAILQHGGVQPVRAVGLGFDDPLPAYPPTDAHQRSVVCQLIPATHH